MKILTPHAGRFAHGPVSEPGRIYLITCVTHRRNALFTDWRCGRLLVQVLHGQSARATTLAYVIMPDRLNWLIRLRDKATLGGLLRTVKGISSWQINRHLKRSGRVWQAGYHDHALRDEDDLLTTARYLVATPLRAGLVQQIGDYPLWDAMWL